MEINEIFDRIMVGDGSVINSNNTRILNEKALELHQIATLTPDQVETLKKILMICNVLYNRTDMTVLPIEDGFYDLLLEKYKQYDSNFQVGSAVVDVRNLIENDINNPRKIAKQALIFEPQEPRDETHQFIHDKMMRVGLPILDRKDYTPNPPIEASAPITKRTHNTAHNHPNLVGTLDKAKFVMIQDAINAGVADDPTVCILERDFFGKHISEGIIDPRKEIEIIVELKYDGVSVEADCTTEVLSARTRGDTGIGEAADITPILAHYPFKHAEAKYFKKGPIGVKFEAIVTKANLELLNTKRGKSYVNCRSAIVGIMGASDAYQYRDYITLVPLEVDRANVPSINNRITEIEFLNTLFRSHGEPLRYCYFKGTLPEILYYIKAFMDEAKRAKDFLNFMYDGIVVSYLNEKIRARLGRTNFVNKYSMAVKFDPLEKLTIFRGYTFEIGQTGTITPMLHYDPVEFIGTIHTKSSGSSYSRFNEMALKYGDIISIQYRNDVMPYVVGKIDCDSNRNNPNPVIEFPKVCPVCGGPLEISESGFSAMCVNRDCPGRSLQRMVNMFGKLNIKGFASNSFKLLGKTHLYELANITQEQAKAILGEADGEKFFYEMTRLVMVPIKDYVIMSSLGFSNVGNKKWQDILNKVKVEDIQKAYENADGDLTRFRYVLYDLVGAERASVVLDTIINEWEFFVKDVQFILKNVELIHTQGTLTTASLQIVFTGFRDDVLAEKLTNLGFEVTDSSVTKKTILVVAPINGYISSKTIKANQRGIRICTKHELLKNSMEIIGVKLD